ncbi:hypothetical protein [Streptomyces alboflavus]|uniref:hypothetical protein n=1 Tax=Streptomyces alboflavus TaxID=67267 RepID=UPI0036B2F65C
MNSRRTATSVSPSPVAYRFDAARTAVAIKDALDLVTADRGRVSALATRLLRDLVHLIHTDLLRECEDKYVVAELRRATAFVTGHSKPLPGESPHEHLQKLAYETRCMLLSHQLLVGRAEEGVR